MSDTELSLRGALVTRQSIFLENHFLDCFATLAMTKGERYFRFFIGT